MIWPNEVHSKIATSLELIRGFRFSVNGSILYLAFIGLKKTSTVLVIGYL